MFKFSKKKREAQTDLEIVSETTTITTAAATASAPTFDIMDDNSSYDDVDVCEAGRLAVDPSIMPTSEPLVVVTTDDDDDTNNKKKRSWAGALKNNFHLRHMEFVCQMIIITAVVITSLYNLSASGQQQQPDPIWVGLLGSCLGYITPGPHLTAVTANRKAPEKQSVGTSTRQDEL